MAAGNFTLYNQGKLRVLNGVIVFQTNAVAAALLGTGYTPALTHSTWSDVSAQEIADGDYAQQALTTKSVGESSGTIKFDADDVAFGDPVTITAKYLVLVKGTATSLTGTDELMGYVDLNTDSGSATVSSVSSEFTVRWNASNGLFTVT